MSEDDSTKWKDVDSVFERLGKKVGPIDCMSISKDKNSYKKDNFTLFDNLLMMVEKSQLVTDKEITETTRSQLEVEEAISKIYESLLENGIMDEPFFLSKHLNYLELSLMKALPSPFKSLDASHPWMLYWIINANTLLHDKIPSDVKVMVSQKLRTCLNETGGFGGGKGQVSHAASTFAATLSLCLIGDYDTLQQMRESTYDWFLSLKKSDGSFSMHKGGESDTRSTYCVLITASILNILTPMLIENTTTWIKSCQTYEGGFSGTSNSEAHGGYTYCAVASLCLLHPATELGSHCNLDSLIRWCSLRQYQLEGGFSGRTNKLVDACYAHWVGSVFPFLEMASGCKSLFNRASLQSYLLNCCQSVKIGGFRDKPGKSQDFYHTNYSLAGLSTAQHLSKFNREKYSELSSSHPIDCAAYCIDTVPVDDDSIITIGENANILGINPIFGLPIGVAESCKAHFLSIDSHD